MAQAKEGDLSRVRRAAALKREAKNEYYEAIKEAAEKGFTNHEIGLAAGVSEAAVRLMRKRRAATQ